MVRGNPSRKKTLCMFTSLLIAFLCSDEFTDAGMEMIRQWHMSISFLMFAVIVNEPRGVMPQVILTSDLSDGNICYDAQIVTFRCIMNSTEKFLAWSSHDYIGPGGIVLEFASVGNPERTLHSVLRQTTVATLISVTADNNTGVTVIESELRITISIQYPNSSVSCQVDNHGISNTITFSVVQPDVHLTSNLTKETVTYDNTIIIFMCTIQGAGEIILSWSSNDYIGPGGDMIEFVSVDHPEETEPKSSSSNPTTTATLISVTTDNDTRETKIVSELHIRASAQYPTSSVSCRHDGHGTVNTSTFRTLNATATTTEMSPTEMATTLDQTTLAPDSPPNAATSAEQNTGQTSLIAIIVTVPVIAVVIFVVMLAGGCVLFLYASRTRSLRNHAPLRTSYHEEKRLSEITNEDENEQSLRSGTEINMSTSRSSLQSRTKLEALS